MTTTRTSSALDRILRTQLSVYPAHASFLDKRLHAAPLAGLAFLEQVAGQIETIAGEHLEDFCLGYRWLCEAVFEEELHFRRTGKYRLDRFADAVEQVYANHELMTRYMRGLLLTQLWWSNHTAALMVYRNEFLAGNKDGFAHLEVGPGHGLLLHMALQHPLSGIVEAIDVSQASLDETRHVLSLLGSPKQPLLTERNLFSGAPWEKFYDSLVIAEVLEHLETPVAALERLAEAANPGARLFVHMPVNSPAPDHIYLVRSVEEVLDLVRRSGWAVERHFAFPSTGLSLEKAIRREAAISVVVIGTAPGRKS